MATDANVKQKMSQGLGLPQDSLYLMTEIVRYREKRLSTLLNQKGITLHEWRALRILYSFKGDVPMGELIAHSQTDRTALGRTINQLVQRGWVERFPAPDDKRALYLRVTSQSQETFEQVWKMVTEFDQQFQASLSENDHVIFKKILKNMMVNMDISEQGSQL